jgi:heme A synthase
MLRQLQRRFERRRGGIKVLERYGKMASVLGKAMHMMATLVFLALAYYNYLAPSPLCTVPGPLGFLSSMWFMYVLMAVIHTGMWLTQMRKGESCGCGEPAASEASPLPSK